MVSQERPDSTGALTSHYNRAVAFPTACKCPIKGNGEVGRDEEGRPDPEHCEMAEAATRWSNVSKGID
jgi:hypothetical protein